MSRRRHSWTALIWFLPVLVGLALIYRRLLAGRMLATGDLQTYFHPYWTEIARALQEGRLPLWNAYLFNGAPLLANSQAGVLYPLNWPLWLLFKGTPMGAAKALHASILLHLGLAAGSAFFVARRWGLRPPSAAVGALFYAGSGFLGLHVEHLNQLQGLAWLPLLLLPGRGGDWLPAPLSLAAWTMILLTGHSQTGFISAVVLLLWRGGTLAAHLWTERTEGTTSTRAVLWRRFGETLGSWGWGLSVFGLGVIAATAQLLPTLQLAQLSTRSGGLPWREAVSFSIAPWELPRALLPTTLVPPLLPEGVAYIGLSGWVLGAVGAWWGIRARKRRVALLVLLGGMGLLLAMGGYNPLYALVVRAGVPGFVHFRAPARYLALTVLGGALLAAYGVEALFSNEVLRVRRPWVRRGALAAVCLVGAAELTAAADALPHADATSPAAYADLRPATAYLKAEAERTRDQDLPPQRFLSISQMLFEVGDKSELAAIYDEFLSEDGLWSLWVSAKQREVLTPNLPMAFGVPAADGYDGGLLPLKHYSAFSRLLVPGGTLDGRLRENLPGVPDPRWLSTLGVRFVLTDKTLDAWVDDVFYDRQFQPELQSEESLSPAFLPDDFEANALGLLYEGSGGRVTAVLDSEEVGYDLPPVEDGASEGSALRLRWGDAQRVRRLSFEAGTSALHLQGASLVDERTGAFYPLVLSDRFKLVHSGDIKIYEDTREGPWMMALSACRTARSDAEAAEQMQNPDFDPSRTLMLVTEKDPDALPQPCGAVTLTDDDPAVIRQVKYEPGKITAEVETDQPVYLLLKEAWYPGWDATLTPLSGAERGARSAEVLRGNLLMMVAPIPEGRWRIEFVYRPKVVAWGLGMSAVGWLGAAAYAGYWTRQGSQGSTDRRQRGEVSA